MGLAASRLAWTMLVLDSFQWHANNRGADALSSPRLADVSGAFSGRLHSCAAEDQRVNSCEAPLSERLSEIVHERPYPCRPQTRFAMTPAWPDEAADDDPPVSSSRSTDTLRQARKHVWVMRSHALLKHATRNLRLKTETCRMCTLTSVL